MNYKNFPLWDYFIEIGFSLGLTILLFLLMPAFSLNPDIGMDFLFSLFNFEMSEYLVQFVVTLNFLLLIFYIPIVLTTIGYAVVWLIYRISLIRIYSKPRRVYPVEKQKFFSLY